MKMLLVCLVLLASCDIYVEPAGCRSDLDCVAGDFCDAGYCSDGFGLPSGHIVLECDCWGYTDGSVAYNSSCISGYEAPFFCSGWCPDGEIPYGATCE